MPYPYTAPSYGADQPFQAANEAFEQASNYAMPSMASQDKAAARVRSRVNQQRLGNDQTTNDTYQRRGMGGSGQHRAAMQGNLYSADQAYASGLAEMESDFADKQQKGADIYSQIGAGYGQIGYNRGQLGNQIRGQDSEYDIAQGKLANDRADLEERGSNNLNTNLINSILALGQAGNTELDDGALSNLFRSLGIRLGGNLGV